MGCSHGCLVVDSGLLNVKLVSRLPRFGSGICLEMMVAGFSLLLWALAIPLAIHYIMIITTWTPQIFSILECCDQPMRSFHSYPSSFGSPLKCPVNCKFSVILANSTGWDLSMSSQMLTLVRLCRRLFPQVGSSVTTVSSGFKWLSQERESREFEMERPAKDGWVSILHKVNSF